MSYVHHVVRRAVEHPSAGSFIKRATEEGAKLKVPGWGMALLCSTAILGVIFISLVEYTLRYVVATLAMVETPSAAITVSPSAESAPKSMKEDALETGPTITLVHQKPVTSSIRGTIRHLAAHAGRFSRFRGFKLFLLDALCYSFVFSLLDMSFPQLPGRLVLISAAAGAASANIHATLTHKIISMPTDKTFRQRLVPCSQWKVLALPAAVKSSAVYLSIYVAQGLAVLVGLIDIHHSNFADYTGKHWVSLVLRSLAVITIALCCALFIVLPALVTLVRVEASILPEDQDTIVPLDRTFGGKVVPRILGGSGAVGFLDAWRSFNWEARRRLLKLYVKIFAILSLLTIALMHLLALEMWAVMGPALGKLLAQAKHEGVAN